MSRAARRVRCDIVQGLAALDAVTFRLGSRRMNRLIALPTRIFPTAESFVNDWNSDSRCLATAVAHVPPAREAVYAAEILNAVLVVLGEVSVGVAAHAVYDLVCDHLAVRTRRRVTY